MCMLQNTIGYRIVTQWMHSKGLKPFAFQEETWQHVLKTESGLVNAPTGCGKTYAVFLGSIIRFINTHPQSYQQLKYNGLQLLWITPLRALAKDIARAMQEVITELNMSWEVGIRNGDTTIAERNRQKKNTPEILIITPESLHLLLAQKNNHSFFASLETIAIDEWHELMGSKRGVQTELALSRIIPIAAHNKSGVSVWGISATIGNLEEAKEVLLSPLHRSKLIETFVIQANLPKQTEIISIIPDEIEKYPWAGHLGIKLAEKIVPIIEQSNTTLIFINTRGMSEMWYQTLLNIAPQLAGAIALHHGSIEQELRLWVEESLHTKKLKAVVCTASLDLGVDFRPVDTVIQVGSPKGISRFLQRAGRSGHQPGDTSKIYFLPTHSLELVEAAALKKAVSSRIIESKEPLVLCFDVLMQYMCTLAVGDGFVPEQLLPEIRSTYSFSEITDTEWKEILQHLSTGGTALQHYDDYKKIEITDDGVYTIKNRRMAMRHRMHIGTIVSDAMLKVKLLNGKYIGVIEEWFVSRLETGTTFTLAGRNLELVGIKDMSVIVKPSASKKTIVPSWMGGRMSLSANLGKILRETFAEAEAMVNGQLTMDNSCNELQALQPLFQLQQELSHIPSDKETLIEQIESKDGYHLLVYPFEGRQVHEAMSALIAYRISRITPITFSIAMNDYGFELLSDQPIPVDDTNVHELFFTNHLLNDIQKSVNSTEMARRKFRDIAAIGGLIFQGYPGEHKKARHLQSSAGLLFNVFEEYEPNNILLRQAYNEVLEQQMEEVRLRSALNRIAGNKIVLTFPEKFTPLSFPIVVDGLNRNNLSSEKMEERVKRMQQQLNK
ncbi:MAG: ligase-associated DNA damage response DEXH box helicase [Sphingobacteriia bacterium]|nr:ligase-associated DNA damage response DEXH box helicase [Sphingobacteriia bacterium]